MTDVEINAVWRRIGGRSAYMRSAPKSLVTMTMMIQPETREKAVIITDYQQWLQAMRDSYCGEFDDDFGPEFERIDATEQMQMEWSYRR